MSLPHGCNLRKMKFIIIVLDSVGIGEAPDAREYGDTGANTLAHIAQSVNGLHIPTLRAMGLGNIPLLTSGLPIQGVAPTNTPIASYGAMQEVSKGKDTTTGHWEMAGIELKNGFHIFPPGPPSFPVNLISEFEARTGRKILGNKAANGISIINELGETQMKTGAWITYTSADSVFQIAAHEEIIPLDELYRACRIARELCDHYMVGRVIARPYLGIPSAFKRTENRHDFSYKMPGESIFHSLHSAGITTITVGKLDDIFAGAPISRSMHMENNKGAQDAILNLIVDGESAFIFANFIDFDMLFGHRRDPAGYADALQKTDLFLKKIIPLLKGDDVLVITADHGNDPTFRGSDHTREYVPLLVYRAHQPGRNLGIRQGFFDLAQSAATLFQSQPLRLGVSFI